MKKRLCYMLILYVIIVVSSIMLLGGCKKGKNPSSPQGKQMSQNENKSGEVPNELKKMEGSIEKLIADLDTSNQIKPLLPTSQNAGNQPPSGDNSAGQVTSSSPKPSTTQNQDNLGKASSGPSGEPGQTATPNPSNDGNQNSSPSQTQAATGQPGNSQTPGVGQSGSNQPGATQQVKSNQQQGNKGLTSSQGKTGVTTNEPIAAGNQRTLQWSQIMSSLEDLHLQWNNYIPLAINRHASSETIQKFDNSLNNLSNMAAGQNNMNTLIAANTAYFDLLDFFRLYILKTSPDIKKMKYYVRSVILSSLAGNWGKTDNDINMIRSVWPTYRSSIKSEKKGDEDKLDFSISELEKVTKERNKLLTSLKGKITIANIETLDKG